MGKDKIQTNYVSEIDQFIQNFDQTHPEQSKSQQKEIDKFKRIYRLRDTASAKDSSDDKMWDL